MLLLYYVFIYVISIIYIVYAHTYIVAMIVFLCNVWYICDSLPDFKLLDFKLLLQ